MKSWHWPVSHELGKRLHTSQQQMSGKGLVTSAHKALRVGRLTPVAVDSQLRTRFPASATVGATLVELVGSRARLAQWARAPCARPLCQATLPGQAGPALTGSQGPARAFTRPRSRWLGCIVPFAFAVMGSTCLGLMKYPL